MTVQYLLKRKGERVITRPFDATIKDIVETMAAENVGTVMLIDENGRLAGILSERDIVRFFAEQGVGAIEIPAREMMTQEVVTCGAETSLEEVLMLMSTHEIRHIPVMCDDNVLGLISIRDILNFRCEMIVVEARDQIATANRTKSEFLANMGHELRTPLNAIIGFSKIMTTEALGPIGTPEYREYANDINEAGTHLLAVINDILDLSKIETGMHELKEDYINIADLIGSVRTLLRERAAKAKIEIETEIEENAPALYADEGKVKRILANILTNAVKFNQPGGKITIKSWCRPESGYVIQVVDTGIGIAAEDIPKALTQFGQVESDHNRAYEGTGLGLPLTKALVELHGGAFDLQSEVGVGTTVTVRFPATRIEKAA